MCPIKKSAKKALRQSLKRKARNLRKKRKVKSLQKQVRTLVSEKKIEQAKKLLPQIYKALDKAAKTGVIEQGKVAREKSKITKILNQPPKEK